ncbi:MAG: glutamate synthase-related protein [Candidatus Latescibacteria bacterium]|jgi:glutamate synthase domain-containing protein 2/rubredoxin|nr:glutamate synthase-related protein [Candidatus Latescibacterota bacterium]
MSQYTCGVCGYVYDEEQEGTAWGDLPDDWACPLCDADRSMFECEDLPEAGAPSETQTVDVSEAPYLSEWQRPSDDREPYMADIHRMAETGESISEPMRTRLRSISWDDILIKGAQLSKIPLNEDVVVNTQTVIGPDAKTPLVLDTPLYVTHMSFGSLSKEAKLSLARGSAAARTAMCSGEGGILPESMESACRYIFEYVPNRYSVTNENLRSVDAVEIKIGQSAKPGLGGHLPGNKVTEEIAAIRGFPQGADILSPAHYDDIHDRDSLREKVVWLRTQSEGRPIGIKLAAGNIEADLEVALYAEPDFVTLDGREGGTGSAPRFVKDATSVPTQFALYRARKFLDESKANGVSLLITGGLRVSSDFAKALAMGADAVAIGTAAMIAIGCQQYRICNTGKCPVGIATHDPELRARLSVERSAERLTNYLAACTKELADFARLTGNSSVHALSTEDLCTTSSEISNHTAIEHV